MLSMDGGCWVFECWVSLIACIWDMFGSLVLLLVLLRLSEFEWVTLVGL